MTRYELTISPDYVKTWGLYQALREIFQNAVDQQSVDLDNKMSWLYSENTLSISSKKSGLLKSSLLLGNTSKADDKTTIGKFGEGYKLALMVLLRTGYKVKIYNYKYKELWIPKIINSRRYDSKLLVIDVKKHVFKSVPDSDLTFVIDKISNSDFDIVRTKFLFMYKEKPSVIDTKFGSVLTDDSQKGKIYTNGLFVCNCQDEEIRFGYDIKPEFLILDRDREIIDSFNFTWLTSKLWSSHNDNDFVCELIKDKAADVKFIYNFNHLMSDLPDVLFDKFQSRYGATAVPISTQAEKVDLANKYPSLIPIIAGENTVKITSRSSCLANIKSFSEVRVDTPCDILREFLDTHGDSMDDFAFKNLEAIIERSKEWVIK